MTTLLAMVVACAVFGIAGWVAKGRAHHRACPTCRTPYDVTAEAGSEHGNGTYAVLACPTCTNTATLVHGARNHLAYCPACKNRTLETPTQRTDDGVEVHEGCQICGHERVVAVPVARKRGLVIPFPGTRAPDDQRRPSDGRS